MLPTTSAPRRSRRLRVTATAALGVAALGLSAGVPSAGAAVVEGDTIEAFLGTDMVLTGGYPATADIQLVRNGNVIATATDAGDTVLNHDSCWDGPSPDVRPGDVIRAGTNPAAMDSMVVQDISVNLAEISGPQADAVISIVGNAGAAGATLGLRFNDLGQADRDHEVSLPPGPFNTTTTVNANQFASWPPDVVGFESVVNGNELTVFDETAGGTCGPLAATGIGTISHTSLNATPANVTISGPAAPDITSVQVSINGTNHGAAITPSGGTWTKTIPYADFAEGANQVTANFTGASDPGDQSRTITKDTVAPASAPNASPAGGTYTDAQSVTLNGVEGGGAAYYTTDGSTPTTASARYTGPIAITSSQTLRVAQYDAAGNRSPVATHAYVIQAPQQVQQPQPQQQAAPPATIVLIAPPRINAPSANLVSAGSLRMRGSRSLRTLRRKGLKYTVQASGSTRFLLVRLSRVTRSGGRTKRSLVQERVISVRSGGTYAGTLRLGRKTRTGRYELSVTPAGADEEYATAVRSAFSITR